MTVDARRAAFTIGAIAVVIAGYLVLDALVVTEEERLEELVDAVSGVVEPQGIDRALAWVDPAIEPVQVTALGRSELFEEEEPLRRRAHTALGPLRGERLRVLSRTIEVRDDRATVSLRVVGSRGMNDVELRLRRHGDRWLVSDASVHR